MLICNNPFIISKFNNIDQGDNNYYLTNTIYNNKNTWINTTSDNVFNIKGLTSYEDIIQYKNYNNLTKKQLYSLYANNNSNFNNNKENNIYKVKLINIVNTMNNNPKVKFNDILIPPIDRETIDCFQQQSFRSILNVNNYKYFINPSTEIINKYPYLFDDNNKLSSNNLKYLKQFAYNQNYNNLNKKQIYTYLSNNSFKNYRLRNIHKICN